MRTVREATFDLLRAHGMTTIFGNPGSTELPMLKDFPGDFAYVLGLQELVVVGMADGFAQASERVTHVNLHTAPGVGNAIGGISNAHANKAPLLITAGPDIDASGGWEAAVALAEKQRVPVWATPAPGGGRLGFPEDHPNFQGILPPAIGPASETLKGHDLVLVLGSSVFPYYPYIPGELLPAGTALVQVTSDPGGAARAPMGRAIVGGVGPAPERPLGLLGPSGRPAPGA